MKNSNLLVILSLLSCLAMISCTESTAYDVVIHNCKIYNSKTGAFELGSMAISAGKIQAISPENALGRQIIDAKGQYVYPGFIDAHCHFVGYAKFNNSVNLVATKSFDEVIERTLQYRNNNPDITFITGRGWDQNDWEEMNFPTNKRLNELFPDIPVFLTRIDGHAAIVNDVALALADSLPEIIKGGRILRENGVPTGLLVDNAMQLIKIPEPTDNELAKMLIKAQEDCFALGLTGLADAGLDRRTIMLIDSMQKQGILKMPIYAMITDNPSDYEPFFKEGYLKTDLLSVRSIKVYGDGALGSRGALLLADYADAPGHRGLLLKPKNELDALCKKAADAGFQVNVHAIGDSANRIVLQAFAAYVPKGNDLRWRVEHAQVVNPEDYVYFNEYNIIPSVQPTHATSDMYWAEERLGANRINHGYSYKNLLNSAGVVALGTDFPVEDIDPRKTFYAAVFRQDASGFPEGGFLPNERLTRNEAILGMTLWAAFAQFEETEKGSIEPGKWADLLFSETDLLSCSPKEVLSAKFNRTMIHGETVFLRPSN